MKCYACEVELEPEGGLKTDYQFDNALWVGFHGGYGMFIDPLQTSKVLKAQEEAVICHECAHKLCDEVPWIGKLLDPHSSHSHKDSYRKANPNHYGWDYDKQW